MNQITTIIVDNVKLIRIELLALLSEYPQIDIIGEATNGKEAVKLINTLKPDLVFLDISLPVINGFEVLSKVEHNFKLIFISSYDDFRRAAETYNPLDYLTKPINKKKLANTMQKILSLNSH